MERDAVAGANMPRTDASAPCPADGILVAADPGITASAGKIRGDAEIRSKSIAPYRDGCPDPFPAPLLPRQHKYHNQHRTAQGEFTSSFRRDFYLSHRQGYSLDADAATPEFIETLRQRGMPCLATPFFEIIREESLLAPALAQSCTLLAFSPEGAIYRLEPPARVLGDAEARRVPGSRQTQP